MGLHLTMELSSVVLKVCNRKAVMMANWMTKIDQTMRADHLACLMHSPGRSHWAALLPHSIHSINIHPLHLTSHHCSNYCICTQMLQSFLSLHCHSDQSWIIPLWWEHSWAEVQSLHQVAGILGWIEWWAGRFFYIGVLIINVDEFFYGVDFGQRD